MSMPMRSALFVLSILTLAACGGSQPPAEEPASGGEEKAAASDSGEKAKSDDSATDEKKGEEAKKDASAPDSGPGPIKRTPKDMLTAPEVTFMFSFNQSEPHDKAEEKCRAATKGDGKKMADCMRKASAKFGEDGMQFKQDKSGDWVWLTLRRKGSTLTTLHKIPFEFGDEKDTSVVLKPTGRDTGRTPMANVPKEVVIEVPNEFSIVIKDPEAGRLVYEAKIGITSADKGE